MSEREEGERGQGAWGSRGAGLEGELCRSLNPGVSVAQKERERVSETVLEVERSSGEPGLAYSIRHRFFLISKDNISVKFEDISF